jgi:predicted nucleic acid-binding protein
LKFVVDTSVVLKWFRSENEQRVEEARAFLDALVAGEIAIWAPPILHLEVLNVAAKKWKWQAPDLGTLANDVNGLGIEFQEVASVLLVPWIAVGMTAYDAAFVALAESIGASVISDDRRLVELGGNLVIPLEHGRDALS